MGKSKNQEEFAHDGSGPYKGRRSLATSCDPCGPGKELFTRAVGFASAIVAGLGGAHYYQNHSAQMYTCMIATPPINTIMCLLWLVNFAIYAAFFLHSDLDSTKSFIWISLASFVLYLILTVVTWFDWKKYRKEGRKFPALRKYGVYGLGDANYNMDHTGGHHDGSNYA